MHFLTCLYRRHRPHRNVDRQRVNMVSTAYPSFLLTSSILQWWSTSSWHRVYIVSLLYCLHRRHRWHRNVSTSNPFFLVYIADIMLIDIVSTSYPFSSCHCDVDNVDDVNVNEILAMSTMKTRYRFNVVDVAISTMSTMLTSKEV